MRAFFTRLGKDCSGAMAVEFALVAPVFLTMIFGVLFAGSALQNYNALRNLSADAARYAMVQEQNGNILSNTQIRTYALNRGRGTPYLLMANRLNAVVSVPTTQRYTGAREIRLTVTYQVDTYLDFAGVPSPFLTYTRPIFLKAIT